MPLFEYSVTRPIVISRWLEILICLGGVLWFTIVTVVNIAVVGYDLVPVTSTIFNNSYDLWYERLIPLRSWIPQSWTCNGSIIGFGEGIYPLLVGLTVKDVSTNITSYFSYNLAQFLDPQPGTPIDSLLYDGSVLVNCSVNSFYLLQFAFSPVLDQVYAGTCVSKR
jgi:hypothetical protein